MKLVKNTCYYINVKNLTIYRKLNLLIRLQNIFKGELKWGGNSDNNLLEYKTFLEIDKDDWFVIYYYSQKWNIGECILMRPDKLPKHNIVELQLPKIKNKLK